jgi:hypothetical protein
VLRHWWTMLLGAIGLALLPVFGGLWGMVFFVASWLAIFARFMALQRVHPDDRPPGWTMSRLLTMAALTFVSLLAMILFTLVFTLH